MNISARVEYACLAMLELTVRFADGQPIPVRRIAEPHAIPSQFLVQILLQLKAAGLVHSVRGASGGYRLASEPQTICLGDIVRAIEGNASKSAVSTDGEHRLQRIVQGAFERLDALQWDYLDSVTLDDLGRQASPANEPMYYI